MEEVVVGEEASPQDTQLVWEEVEASNMVRNVTAKFIFMSHSL